MRRKTVLVTGAGGYIGNAVAKSFARAGWRVFGLVRSTAHCSDLALHEIYPLVGTVRDLWNLDELGTQALDVIVSNTSDPTSQAEHLGDVRRMLETVSERSNLRGVRPLVMFSSGCKDYGQMALEDGMAPLAPHTEDTPLNPPTSLQARSDFGASLLEDETPGFDTAVLRPTIVYGYSSSHYGELFELASKSSGVLVIKGSPDAIMHSVHVDDCADAYVALAECGQRDAVTRQAFNISNAQYDTAGSIGSALADLYGLSVKFAPSSEEISGPHSSVHALANFSQWVSSGKIRALTGWRERRPSFTHGIEQYRFAYEASLERRSSRSKT